MDGTGYDSWLGAGHIVFQGRAGKWGGFSNDAPYPIVVEGVEWPTVEHYFQAAKHPDCPWLQAAIRRSGDRAEAQRLARSRPVRSDWRGVRDTVMLTALRAKFALHHRLAALLLSTGDDELIQHTTRDTYWGRGEMCDGRNRLGELLMLVRDELSNAKRGAVECPAPSE